MRRTAAQGTAQRRDRSAANSSPAGDSRPAAHASSTSSALPSSSLLVNLGAGGGEMTLEQCKAALASLTATVEAAERAEKRRREEVAAQVKVEAMLNEKMRVRQQLLKFNVGGEMFHVPKANLQCAEGTFFEVIQRGDFEVDRDDDGAIFVDRDPDTFRIIINYIRGYKGIPNLTLGLAHRLLCDAQFYQIDSLAAEMQHYVSGTMPSAAHQFTAPGAGVNIDRTRLRAVYNVSPVGDRLLLSGRHSVTFYVKRAEYVGFGVISDDCASFDSEFHKARNCCVYYMTGITYTNFPLHKKEESSEKFGTGDTVTVVIDMQNRVVEYRLRGTVRCYSCASAVRLRFAVVIKFDSEVTIVDSNTEMPTEFRLMTDTANAAEAPPAGGQ